MNIEVLLDHQYVSGFEVSVVPVTTRPNHNRNGVRREETKTQAAVCEGFWPTRGWLGWVTKGLGWIGWFSRVKADSAPSQSNSTI